jgi:hypothetical protein
VIAMVLSTNITGPLYISEIFWKVAFSIIDQLTHKMTNIVIDKVDI